MDIMAYLETGANAEAEEAIMAMTAANAILDIMVITISIWRVWIVAISSSVSSY